jgi:hypothetical protein
MAKMNWYEVRQNNSGGYFEEPAVVVYIRAPDHEEAAEMLWKSGASNANSCECCGDRWYTTDWPLDDEEKIAQLEAQNIPAQSEFDHRWAQEAGIPVAVILR